MGLDMYLEREVYVGTRAKSSEVTTYKFQGMSGDLEIDKSKIKSFKTDVGYWRKANAIHSWFVRNVQDNVDNCESYLVPEEKMILLYEQCSKAYLTKDPTEFQPAEGFFFGGTEIDEYYWRDILDTMRILEPIVKELRKDWDDRDSLTQSSDFYYRASW